MLVRWNVCCILGVVGRPRICKCCATVCVGMCCLFCVCLCHLGVRCRLFLGGGLVWGVVGGVGVSEFGDVVDFLVGCFVLFVCILYVVFDVCD